MAPGLGPMKTIPSAAQRRAKPAFSERNPNPGWIAWAPVGDRLAYFARADKGKTLIVQNIVTGRTEYRVKLDNVDAP